MKLACMTAVALVAGTVRLSTPTNRVRTDHAIFARGTSSTGWIDFDFFDGKRIFIPAKINGHETMVLLATGLPTPDIDKGFAASIGARRGDTDSVISGLEIQIGDLTLPTTAASVVDFAPLAKHIGHPLPFLLGDEAFKDLVVDIDFAHHRIAFRQPGSQAAPAGAVAVPMTRVQDEHLVPVSIEGATPAQFELGLGNSGEMLVYQSYYQSHNVLEGRRASERLAAGTGGFVVEPVAMLRRAEFAGVAFADFPAAFIPAAQLGAVSDQISGDIGLPILARFRLIIDYAHDRLYAVPDAKSVRAPFAKDRLGLTLTGVNDRFAVRFVAPGSPAQAAGFAVGDTIALIDGKPGQAWAETAVANLRYGAAGATVAFTMGGGAVRRVRLADYF
jgi:hypothetical protein